MSRIVRAALVLLLVTPAVQAEDKPKTATPAEQYQMLLKEYQEAMTSYQEALRNAKTPEERQKVQQEKAPKADKFSPRFLELAEKGPKEPVALDALVWVMTNTSGPGSEAAQARAIELLLRDHIDSDKLAAVCQSLAFGFGKQNAKFLHAVMEKNKSKAVQAEASLALAQHLLQRAGIIQRIQEDPGVTERAEAAFGKETVAEMKKTDLAAIRDQASEALQALADKHIAEIKPERLTSLFRNLQFAPEAVGEPFLRTVLKKDERHDVQGLACLTLGQVLKGRGEEMPADKAPEAEKLLAECEKLFERAAKEFGDVKNNFRGTVGDTARSELLDLRTLSVGKVAPEVKGEDQDGIKFQLADYKGKVVLLDFWSEF
jgi:hypothetical protein